MRLLLGSADAAAATLGRLVRSLDVDRAAGTLSAVDVAAYRTELRALVSIVTLWKFRAEGAEIDALRERLQRLEGTHEVPGHAPPARKA